MNNTKQNTKNPINSFNITNKNSYKIFIIYTHFNLWKRLGQNSTTITQMERLLYTQARFAADLHPVNTFR